MKNIRVSQSFAIVDDSDFEIVSRYKWSLSGPAPFSYARAVKYDTNFRDKNGRLKQIQIRMHRLVLGAKEGQEVDHINGNPLDNRKENLRECSRSQNLMNTRKRTDNKSGFKGVSWSGKAKMWEANIRLNGKRKWLGYFKNKSDAALAYDRAAVQLFGEFALPNYRLCE